MTTKPEKRPARQICDPELIAMHEITEIVSGLDVNECRRVMQWMVNRWGPVLEPLPFSLEDRVTV
jgi:hypothetical protein